MGKNKKKLAKNGRGITRRSLPVLKPQGSTRSRGALWKPYSLPNKLRHVQEILHNRKVSVHTVVFDTGSQQSMIGRDGWVIIKSNYSWIDARGVDLGGPPKADRRLQLVDARGAVKNRQDGKSYLIIIRQAIFNTNYDETLLAEDQIE